MSAFLSLLRRYLSIEYIGSIRGLSKVTLIEEGTAGL